VHSTTAVAHIVDITGKYSDFNPEKRQRQGKEKELIAVEHLDINTLSENRKINIGILEGIALAIAITKQAQIAFFNLDLAIETSQSSNAPIMSSVRQLIRWSFLGSSMPSVCVVFLFNFFTLFCGCSCGE
jgi:hypothetical protein